VTVGVTRRVTLKAAGDLLGISKEAVRKRVSRGTLLSDVGEDGRRYVYLDVGGDAGSDGGDAVAGDDNNIDSLDYRDELIVQLRDEVAAWREEARRKDSIIMQMAQRIPELESPREASPGAREGPQTVSEDPSDTQQAPSQEERRSWWRRWFG
jgi:hypothetical protein